MIKKALVIPDCHIPYEDKRAYEIMLAVAKDINPDEIVILGDYADFFGLSSHGKEAGITELFEEELFCVIERLKELNQLFPNADKVFIEGNHEYRLPRYLNKNCPELYKSITVPKLLMLDHMNYKFIPYGPNQQYSILGSKLLGRHEPLAGGKHVAQNSCEKAMSSLIFGHTHRIQEAQTVAIDGKNYRGISTGWLGNKDHKVMQYVKNHHQWALGFSEVTVLEDGTWFNNLIHIIDYKCNYNGYIYSN